MPQFVGLNKGGSCGLVAKDDLFDAGPGETERRGDFFGRLPGLQLPDDGFNGVSCLISQATGPHPGYFLSAVIMIENLLFGNWTHGLFCVIMLSSSAGLCTLGIGCCNAPSVRGR